MPAPYAGVLFDLFGTLVVFDTRRLPELVVSGERVRSTVVALEGPLRQWVPEVPLEVFWQALGSVSDEMARVRAEDHVELPSRERFRRALERVGCPDGAQAEASVHLSRLHMAQIAGATTFPPEHAAVLAAARACGRVGLVSNFDDTATAYEILRRHGILEHLDAVVVSEAVGLRKPHPAVVREGLRGLGVAAAEAVFVGDTFSEDVAAAEGAGVDAAWIDVRGHGVPPASTPPRYVLRTLAELLPVLSC
jgi:putative hydrolase of the HAD superfamily